MGSGNSSLIGSESYTHRTGNPAFWGPLPEFRVQKGDCFRIPKVDHGRSKNTALIDPQGAFAASRHGDENSFSNGLRLV
jgi:hypothetical protein